MANPTASKVSSKSTAPVSSINTVGVAGEELPDFDKWTDLQIGFAPYWQPKVNEFIFGELVAIDARNPKFIRFQFKAHKTTECRRGPGNDDDSNGPVGEQVIVKPGELFCMSVYYSLVDEFRFHNFFRVKTGKGVPIRVMALKKVKTANAEGRMVWNFGVKADPAITPELDAMRDEYRALLAQADTDRPALAAS